MEQLFVTEEKYEDAIKVCRDLALSRNKRYGNSIDIVRNSSVLDLCLMKLIRTRELSEGDSKYYDEIVDCINYLVYLLMRKNNKKDAEQIQKWM
jgi:hypothetical protein